MKNNPFVKSWKAPGKNSYWPLMHSPAYFSHTGLRQQHPAFLKFIVFVGSCSCLSSPVWLNNSQMWRAQVFLPFGTSPNRRVHQDILFAISATRFCWTEKQNTRKDMQRLHSVSLVFSPLCILQSETFTETIFSRKGLEMLGCNRLWHCHWTRVNCHSLPRPAFSPPRYINNVALST